jgi:hypothetical protein
MKRIVLSGCAVAVAFVLAGCGGGTVGEGPPKDLTPGVPADDPAMNPQLKAFKPGMIKNEPAAPSAPSK